MAPPVAARVGVDIGGTFTDLVAVLPDGTVRTAKVRSTPADPGQALWHAVDAAGVAPAALVHGSTVATNALLERRGARVALVTTEGFEDLLWLRRQDRAALYDLAADHPSPPLARDDVIGVRERIGARGVVTPLSDAEVARVVAAVRARQPEAVAITLLFSFRDPAHERRLADALAAALPDVPVVPSIAVLPVWREYERCATTVAEAYLRPPVGRYLERVAAIGTARGIPELRVMASHGGTLGVAQAAGRAARLALSGPAGGVEAARRFGGAANLLTLDMGGTSTDVSVIVAGEPVREAAGAVGGVPLALPHILIETVGAGGGSIAWLDAGGALKAGPRSAGADPGPACYGRGGTEPTVTDAALVLGWLDADQPLAAGVALDRAAAERAVAALARAAGLTAARCAEGIVAVAAAGMGRALRRVSVERGLDPRDLLLCTFGGAGPLFACRLADGLGQSRALVPPHPGVFSALGLAAAAPRLERVVDAHLPADRSSAAACEALLTPLEQALQAELPGATLARFADCRYPGQGGELPVPYSGTTAAAFHRLHQRRFGHGDPAAPVEIVNLRVVATGTAPALALRSDLPAATWTGPVTVALPDATVRIERGWRGARRGDGSILLERSA